MSHFVEVLFFDFCLVSFCWLVRFFFFFTFSLTEYYLRIWNFKPHQRILKQHGVLPSQPCSMAFYLLRQFESQLESQSPGVTWVGQAYVPCWPMADNTHQLGNLGFKKFWAIIDGALHVILRSTLICKKNEITCYWVCAWDALEISLLTFLTDGTKFSQS